MTNSLNFKSIKLNLNQCNRYKNIDRFIDSDEHDEWIDLLVDIRTLGKEKENDMVVSITTRGINNDRLSYSQIDTLSSWCDENGFEIED